MAESRSAEPTLASPLSLLLQEEGHGDRQATDILFLSFTSDLGFFETFALGLAQACGARVTVVNDATVSKYDPRAVRRAGRSYLPGLAACPGAFHPKVMVIAGPARATVAIGSGNLTLAGWQANAELWTVLRGDTDSCPAVLADVGPWLRGLPGFVSFSWGISEALARVADALDALSQASAGRSEPSVRFVSTSTGPILDQLPNVPVDELAVCAPFHDPGATALRALCERLTPRRLKVSYQPECANVDGPALAALLDERLGELSFDDETRYRHGKLIEWVIAGQRYALTGSPNLSSSALLRGVAQGGNCEVGLIAPTSQTLLPAGAPVAANSVRGRKFIWQQVASVGPLLLGATRAEDGLRVLAAHSLPVPGYLELSHATSPPETWERVADIPAGITEMTVTIPADGGSRVRLVIVRSDGSTSYSNVVPVVDPQRATRRPGITAAHAPSTRPDDLFGDPGLAEKFLADLAALRTALPSPPSAVSSAAQGGGAGGRGQTSRDDWERYLDECAGRLGHPLLRFALGLPVSPGDSSYDALLRTSWDEQFADDFEAGLAADDAETVADESPGQTEAARNSLPDLRLAAIAIRRRYRRWAERLTAAAPQLGIPERMLVTRLLMWTAAAGAWEHDDSTWVILLAESLVALGSDDVPAQAEPQLASLAAVALSVVRSHAPRYTHTEETFAYQHAATAIEHLLPWATNDYVDEYRQCLDAAFGSAVHPETVRALAAEVIQADPVADAVWALVERGRDVHRHGDCLLHVIGKFGNPVLMALEAVGAAEQAGVVGAWASSNDGKWALCLWRKPDLITVDASKQLTFWRHYKLSRFLTPHGLALQKSFEGAESVNHGPFVKPFAEAITLLDQLGLSTPMAPSDCNLAVS